MSASARAARKLAPDCVLVNTPPERSPQFGDSKFQKNTNVDAVADVIPQWFAVKKKGRNELDASMINVPVHRPVPAIE
jgi:hypothetical protein